MKNLWTLGIFLLLLPSCQEQEPEAPFIVLSPEQTGIHFNNKIADQPDFNILEYLYFYNGGGVATGDINNDGLPDIFFTSNLGLDKLYLNKGNFQFEDISNRFDSLQLKGWSTGVTFTDINHDGWLDIYVSKLGNYGPFKDHNKLFINKQGKLFIESAKAYGLDFSGFSTQAAFLDYDRDGDLDCYLLNHSVKSPEQFRKSEVRKELDSLAGDRLLEREDDYFDDVTKSAGIYSSSVGFGLGIDVADINGDGWPDIYIANDFHENDYLYINQQDKTFREVISTASGHTSNFSMGCTIEDLNNDLQPDILSLDMKPFDEEVYKKSGGWENLDIYNFKRRYGYHHQSPRNALQINSGEQNGNPVFSERAALYGLEATDWSWSPLVSDFDNDGDKDIYITNGIVRRPNDMDFVKFHFNQKDKNRLNQVEKMPEGAVPNCYFQNDIETNSFLKKDFHQNSISTGAAVADLNLDGRLDIVVNNINAPASILKNNQAFETNHYLRVALQGDPTNYFGIGASVLLYHGGNVQLDFIKSSSGFQSFSEPVAHFGFKGNKVDSLKIFWPDGAVQVELIEVVDSVYHFKKSPIKNNSGILYSTNVQSKNLENYLHQENTFNDQSGNKWLLYNQSTFGPRMTALNEKHIYITGNKNAKSGIIDTETDQFLPLNEKEIATDENCACLIKGKSSPENYLYITHGGNEFKTGNPVLKDVLYQMGDSFQLVNTTDALPPVAYNTSVCNSHDFDKDGDEDIFVGILSDPGQYGSEINSYLLVNNGGTFTKKELPVTEMIYDAVWSDMDGNGFEDLVIAGHWMPVTILYNDGTDFKKYEIPQSAGLWFSVSVDDLDGDGTKDIIAGNYGTNHGLKVSPDSPMTYYLNDFDKNGQEEALVGYYKDGKEVPYPNQESFVSQIPAGKKKYLKNEAYAKARIDELVNKDLLKTAVSKHIVELSSSYFLQNPGGGWKKQVLPMQLQVSPIFVIEKLNAKQFFFGGNFYDIDPNWGRQDAGQLSVFEYDGKDWKDYSKSLNLPLIKGEIRDLLIQDKKLYIALNKDSLKIISLNLQVLN